MMILPAASARNISNNIRQYHIYSISIGATAEDENTPIIVSTDAVLAFFTFIIAMVSNIENANIDTSVLSTPSITPTAIPVKAEWPNVVYDYADRVAFLNNKTIECVGKPEEVFSNKSVIDTFGLELNKKIDKIGRGGMR